MRPELHHRWCHVKESPNTELRGGLHCKYSHLCGSKKGGEYLWSFFKTVLAEMEQRGNSRSVWRDSSSSARPRHSRQGPSGAASSQSRSVCTNTRNTTKAAAHPCKQWAGQSQEPEGGLALRGSSERSQVLHNKSFIAVGTRARPRE